MSDQPAERNDSTPQDDAVDGSWQEAQERNDQGAAGDDPADNGADDSEHRSASGARDSDADRPGHGRSDELTDGEPTVSDEAGLDPSNDGEVDSPGLSAATSGSASPGDGDDADKPLEDLDPKDRDEQGPEEATREQRAQQMPGELKVDLDEDKLKAWEDVRGEYGIKEGAERPILTGEGNPEPVTEEPADAEARDVAHADTRTDADTDTDATTDRDTDDVPSAGDATSGSGRDARADHDHDNRSSQEPTDGQTT